MAIEDMINPQTWDGHIGLVHFCGRFPAKGEYVCIHRTNIGIQSDQLVTYGSVVLSESLKQDPYVRVLIDLDAYLVANGISIDEASQVYSAVCGNPSMEDMQKAYEFAKPVFLYLITEKEHDPEFLLH